VFATVRLTLRARAVRRQVTRHIAKEMCDEIISSSTKFGFQASRAANSCAQPNYHSITLRLS
jgi:hypothetical protein